MSVIQRSHAIVGPKLKTAPAIEAIDTFWAKPLIGTGSPSEMDRSRRIDHGTNNQVYSVGRKDRDV